MSKGTKKASKKSTKVKVVEAPEAETRNAIDVLKSVGQQQTGKVEMTPELREQHIEALKQELYGNESLTSKDKKTIRRTLRDTYNYYISRERKNAGSAVIARILTPAGAA